MKKINLICVYLFLIVCISGYLNSIIDFIIYKVGEDIYFINLLKGLGIWLGGLAAIFYLFLFIFSHLKYRKYRKTIKLNKREALIDLICQLYVFVYFILGLSFYLIQIPLTNMIESNLVFFNNYVNLFSIVYIISILLVIVLPVFIYNKKKTMHL